MRKLVYVLFGVATLLSPVPMASHFPARAVAQQPRPTATLKERLEAGLKARRPVEFAFIAKVVGMVENGQLPLDLVMGTFQWARDKHPRIPFPYFERGLRVRAARVGIVIP